MFIFIVMSHHFEAQKRKLTTELTFTYVWFNFGLPLFSGCRGCQSSLYFLNFKGVAFLEIEPYCPFS